MAKDKGRKIPEVATPMDNSAKLVKPGSTALLPSDVKSPEFFGQVNSGGPDGCAK